MTRRSGSWRATEALRVVAVTVGLPTLLLFVLSTSDFVRVATASESTLRNYPFGSEGPAAGRWEYASRENYLIATGVGATLALSAVAMLTVSYRRRARLGILFGLILVVVTWWSPVSFILGADT